MYSAAGTTEALQSNACRREKVSYRLTGLYVYVVLPLAEESYVGNEASAESSCYFRENSRCPRSLKVVSFFVRGVVEVSSPIHQSAHRARIMRWSSRDTASPASAALTRSLVFGLKNSRRKV